MNFRYIDRGKENLLVLIPGWASDYRIFSDLDLEFNYLLPFTFSPFCFARGLLHEIKERNIKKISLFAWSLGGFVGVEFAIRYPRLIDEIILVSIRKQYNKEKLKEIKRYLNKNSKAYLYKFYNQCFYKKEHMTWFREKLLKDYCNKFDLDYLLESLDYLENARIKPKSLQIIKNIKIVHGDQDRIAPVQEAIDLKNNLPQAKFRCIKEAGHIPFFAEGFNKAI
jgi:pimeloyl-[acyl-carrier protein] methyl ester esterase